MAWPRKRTARGDPPDDRDDVTGRGAERALAFLSRASQVLASSLDYQTTLTNVARLAVPDLADWCVVDIVAEDGSICRLAAAHADPEKEHWAQEVSRRYPPDEGGATALVLRTGQSHLVPTVTDEMLAAAARDAVHLAAIREPGMRSAMTVPMTARERILGAITLISTQSGRQYGTDDLLVAEDLAQRAALAIDNARLYREVEAARAVAEESQRHLHDLFMQAPALIAVARGPDHVFELVNPPLIQLLGDRTFLHQSLHDTIPEIADQGIVALIDRVYVTGEPFVANEMRVELDRNGDGRLEEGYFNFVLQPTRGAQGEIDGVMVHGVEVTEQVQARQQVERLAAEQEDFLSAAAHDLKTPLTHIKGQAQLLSRRADHLAEKVGEAEVAEVRAMQTGLEQIGARVTAMAALIDELLDATRLHMERSLELHVEPTDLVSLAREVVADHQPMRKRCRLGVVSGQPALIGRWDQARLERVLGNLLSNAIKYSPDGGEIVVTVAQDEGEDGAQAVLTVEDHGMGIPAADLPHIFERFYRASNVTGRITGAGIGLAGIRQIVEQHGGTVAVTSQEGAGSVFTVRLPVDNRGRIDEA